MKVVAGWVLGLLLVVAVGVGMDAAFGATPVASTSPAASRHLPRRPARLPSFENVSLARLPFSIAIGVYDPSSSTDTLWVAGRGQPARRVPVEASWEFGGSSWSADGRFLVGVGGLDQQYVWRYDVESHSLRTWPCGGCQGASIVGDGIVTVDSKLGLWRFPLVGTEPVRLGQLRGLPAWSTHPLVPGPWGPPVVDGTATRLLVELPLDVGANSVSGVYAEVDGTGRFVRMVIGRGRTGSGVPVGWSLAGQGVSRGTVILAEAAETSACTVPSSIASISLGDGRVENYPYPSPAAGMSPEIFDLALDETGHLWAAAAGSGWRDGRCTGTVPTLYRWSGRRWRPEVGQAIGVSFGYDGQELVVRARAISPDGPETGTLELLRPHGATRLARHVDFVLAAQ